MKVKKLEGIPKIYYLNYDEREDRKEFIENQFKEYNIDNFERVTKSRYSPVNYECWRDEILDIEKIEIFHTPIDLSTTINHLQTIIDWYDNEEDDYCIIMEDVIDFSVCKYWAFDWKYLMSNIPYNWDCIELFTVGPQYIPMHLKPKDGMIRSISCYMITRHFAKKVKEQHYIGEKFKLLVDTKDFTIPEYDNGNLNYFLYELGLTYSLPVFKVNEQLVKNIDYYDDNSSEMKDEDKLKLVIQKLSSDAIDYWWSSKSKNFSISEFFSYNKKYDWRMEVEIDIKKQEVFKDRDSKIIIWI